MQQSPNLLATYEPIAGAFDEAIDGSGQIRPGWTDVFARLTELGEDGLRQRWQQAQNQIERDGVTYNPHDEEGIVSRPWTLDPIPLLVQEAEWSALTDRMSQRMRVLNAVLTDLFSNQRLIKDGIIPPELLYGHPAWYPAYQELHRPGQQYITSGATDLARSSDGSWWVTGDRTRSPFGLGYVLENRIVTSRMLSSVFRKTSVRRLAGFYAALKQELRKQAPRFQENPRIVIWTKGPQSRGYFEDSYLARYLGYTLAEAGDLAVRGNRVQLLTLGGLLPVEVLWRRVNDDDCDSVELNPRSTNGISALLDVLRDGNVAVANGIGSRLLESPAFLPFLPAASRHLLGEELQIPSIATWWCGSAKECQHVVQNLDSMLIRPAFRTADVKPIVGRMLSAEAREKLIQRIQAQPTRFVGQEAIDRSTTPVLTEDGIRPWYLGLRAFHVAAGDGFRSMPGGLARVSPDPQTLYFTMSDGERSQDVWIVADQPVEEVSLLGTSSSQIEPRRGGADLPSRVADNFFWLGRYAERAIQTARLLRTLYRSFVSEDAYGHDKLPLLRLLAEQQGLEISSDPVDDGTWSAELVERITRSSLDPSGAMSLKCSLDNAVRTAMRVRDRISHDMWRAVDELDSFFRPLVDDRPRESTEMLLLIDNVLKDLAAMQGLASEGMTRTLGWNFFDIGLRLERATQTAKLIQSFFVSTENDDAESLETLLTTTDSLMTYRSRYLANFQVPVVLDLLMTDLTNPRSLNWQLVRINDHFDAMPGNSERAVLAPEQKVAMSLGNAVRLMDVYEVSTVDEDGRRTKLQKLLTRVEEGLPRLSDMIAGRYLIHAGLPRHFASSRSADRDSAS
ncbi:MAG: circularly permuted type 2 ATP-grasp protein [Fuerstiella sp.]